LKKKTLLLPFVTLVLIGCATTDDLRRVQMEFDRRIKAVDEKVEPVVDNKILALDPKFAALKAENVALRTELERTGEAISTSRKNTAETGANLTDIRDNLQQLRGQLESQVEALRKELTAFTARSGRREEENKDIRDKLNNINFKLNFIENFLGIGKREEQAEGTDKNEKSKDVAKGKPDKESAYAAAYELFKEGKFDKSREAFQNFLKQYPDTEYSDNAQFWIGECYYFEKKYENAILEYEKVAKNYPAGDKVSNALLKQGISFLNLGDKASAKLILERVIRDYPNTNQARTAKATLLNIK